MRTQNTPHTNLAEVARQALQYRPSAVLVTVGSDEHVQILDRVARARCAEWLDREHGMDAMFARTLVDAILDLYADSTQVRRADVLARLDVQR